MTSPRTLFFKALKPLIATALALSFVGPEVECLNRSKAFDLSGGTTIHLVDSSPKDHATCQVHTIEKFTLAQSLYSRSNCGTPKLTLFLDRHLNASIKFEKTLANKFKLYVKSNQSRIPTQTIARIRATTVILV